MVPFNLKVLAKIRWVLACLDFSWNSLLCNVSIICILKTKTDTGNNVSQMGNWETLGKHVCAMNVSVNACKDHSIPLFTEWHSKQITLHYPLCTHTGIWSFHFDIHSENSFTTHTVYFSYSRCHVHIHVVHTAGYVQQFSCGQKPIIHLYVFSTKRF